MQLPIWFRGVVGLYLLAGILLALFTIYLCYQIIWAGPFRDLWDFVDIIQRQLSGDWRMQDLLQPYGGVHRILIPKLVFFLDYRFSQGNNLLALTFSVTLHVLGFWVFIKMIMQQPLLQSLDKIVLIGTALFCFFSTRQHAQCHLLRNSSA